ncbi:hypothetical protein [Flavobacterium acetivorans]|nr:hypothetical protein [Flavobacterium sp. F-29]UFH35314.1 hypothetical protein LNP19_14655 [Flavobacterium sp. F-29]
MAKNYFKNSLVIKAMKPKKEVVSFLLNYSKALSVVKADDRNYEIISN